MSSLPHFDGLSSLCIQKLDGSVPGDTVDTFDTCQFQPTKECANQILPAPSGVNATPLHDFLKARVVHKCS